MSDSQEHALLLVGSPRGFKSTSAALGTYLLEKLRTGGFETEKCIFKPQFVQKR